MTGLPSSLWHAFADVFAAMPPAQRHALYVLSALLVAVASGGYPDPRE